MELLIARCAGLDVHQATVVATVRMPGPDGGRATVTETFGTMTPDLRALHDWLRAYGVTHVAIESTGVYWKPVYYILEHAFTLLLINRQELKRVPGRKTDVKDREWLAQLLECGLLRASVVPPPGDSRAAGSHTVPRAASPRSQPGDQSVVQSPGRCGDQTDECRE